MVQDNIYNEYKPFRNYLRQFEVFESLEVIYNYTQFLVNKRQIDPGIDISGLKYCSSPANSLQGFYLERIAVEIIINGQFFRTKDTFRKWNSLAGAQDRLRAFEEVVAGETISTENVMMEMFRLKFRQFEWQQYIPHMGWIMRYKKILESPRIAPHLIKHFGLSVDEFFAHCFAYYGGFIKHPYMRKIVTGESDRRIFSKEKAEVILKHFAVRIEDLRALLIEEKKLDHTYAYAYHSLRNRPIILREKDGEEMAFCPLSPLLVWRFTSGVFYDLSNEPNFLEDWGYAFNDYVGEVLTKGVNVIGQVEREIEYRLGKDRKDTSDWSILTPKGVLLIECKTKRPTIKTRSALHYEEMGKDIDILTKNIVQPYKVIHDILLGNIKKFPTDQPIFPLVVTLEEWWMDAYIGKELNKKILVEFEKENLPTSYLEKYPYSILSIHDFEALVVVGEKIDLIELMRKRFDSSSELRNWMLMPYLLREHKTILTEKGDLFSSEFEVFFERMRAKAKQ